MKKLISILLSITMLLSITAGIDFSAFALDSSGKCGDNVTYSFDSSTGTLTISGTGDMYNCEGDGPFFNNSSINKIIIENGVTSIGNDAFDYCSGLTSLTIPESVTYIGSWALRGCSSLESITVDKNNEYFYSGDNGNSIITKKDIFSNYGENNKYIVYNADTLVAVCKNTNIPDGVKYIGSDVFSGHIELTSITIPDSVTSIGDSAFYGSTGLTSVTIPDSVTFIGWCAFEGCDNLKDVYYSGSEDQWHRINIADRNDSLENANIHYLGKDNPSEPSTKPETPVTPNKPNNAKPSSKPAPKASNAKSAAKPANNISAQIKTFSNISVKLNKVKKGKKSFTATWKKVKGVDGYQIQYSLKKNMKKSKKKTVKASKSKLKVKKLKKGKKYYVRIRTYKTINGKKVYGKWSAKKTVKIK